MGAKHTLGPWQPMNTAPKDGTTVLVLIDGSSIPHGARWYRWPASAQPAQDGWYFTWDGWQVVPERDGPRYWMHCPDDPDA